MRPAPRKILLYANKMQLCTKKRGNRYRNAGGGALPRAKRLNYRFPCSAYSETDTPSDDSPTTPRTTRTSSTYATISHERADFAASEQSESPSL